MTQVINNYAEVLLELGVTREEAVEAEQILKITPLLQETLENPLISQAEKERVIDRIFQEPEGCLSGDLMGRSASCLEGSLKGCPEGHPEGHPAGCTMVRFLKVACRHGRIGEMTEIFEGFRELLGRREGMLRATLYYVTPPGEAVEEKMKAFLRQKYGKREVELILEPEPSLIGGFLLQAEDREYDYSLRGRYRRLSQALIRR